MSDKKRQPKKAEVKSPLTKVNKSRMIEALRLSLGVVSTACKTAGINRSTFYDWVEKDPEFKSLVEAIAEESIDFAESKLFERIRGHVFEEKTYYFPVDKSTGEPVKTLSEVKVKEILPDTASIIFYLKTIGKKRGYVERQEIDLNGSLNVLVGDETEPEDLPG